MKTKGRRLAWINKEIMRKINVHRMCKRCQVTWEEYRNVRVCCDAIRRAKAHLKFNLARGVKDNNKDFFKYIRNKNKTIENDGLLVNGTGVLVTKDSEKAVTECFFASVFTSEMSPLESQTLDIWEEVQKKEDFPSVEEAWVKINLGKFNSQKSMGPIGMYS